MPRKCQNKLHQSEMPHTWEKHHLKDQNQNRYWRNVRSPRTREMLHDQRKGRKHVKTSHGKEENGVKQPKGASYWAQNAPGTKEERERIGNRKGEKKKFMVYFQSVRKHVEIFLSGCLRNNNTQYPRFEITACTKPENMVSVETRTAEILKRG